MKIIMSHPTGNANFRSAASGFLESNVLTSLFTTIATFPGGFAEYLPDFAPFSDFKRRNYDLPLKTFTKCFPWLELARLGSNKLGLMNLCGKEKSLFSIDSVYRDLDRKVAAALNPEFKGNTAIYAYEDGALKSFLKATEFGITRFYDLPIGYWRASREILARETDRWPAWASTMTGLADSTEKLCRKDEELALADRIFVASTFTSRTLENFPGQLAPVEIIPYGYPEVIQDRHYDVRQDKPLKLLFVGELSQRKGLANLFAAVKKIGKAVQLTVVGRKVGGYCPELEAGLAGCTWIPGLPHHDILNLMRTHDVLAFPSLFEGFGLAITEAMSQGLPVIATERTAGLDLIKTDENGWLIEAGSTDGLQEAIEKILLDRELIVSVGKAAMETAKNRTWQDYGRELSAAVLKHFNETLQQ